MTPARRAVIALLLAGAAGTAAARTITDSAGRTVEVPDRVERVFAAGPPAAVLVYVLKPESLVGWPRALRPAQRRYVAAPYRHLRETGRLTGRGGTANLEVVLATHPDLIVDFGSVRDTYVSLANRVQAQTGIPYVLVDGRFANTPAALRLLGAALGVPKRGEALARWTEKLFAQVDGALAAVPEAKRPRVYLARGPDGLETGLKGSINTEIIERAGGRNVADAGPKHRGITRVSMERVITENPDTIVTWESRFYAHVWKDPLWANIAAVRAHRVYLSPMAPFGWIDRPPSLNRLIGLRWLAGLFYPQRFPGDFRAEVHDFYKRFYHVDLGAAALDRLLAWAAGRAP